MKKCHWGVVFLSCKLSEEDASEPKPMKVKGQKVPAGREQQTGAWAAVCAGLAAALAWFWFHISWLRGTSHLCRPVMHRSNLTGPFSCNPSKSSFCSQSQCTLVCWAPLWLICRIQWVLPGCEAADLVVRTDWEQMRAPQTLTSGLPLPPRHLPTNPDETQREPAARLD